MKFPSRSRARLFALKAVTFCGLLLPMVWLAIEWLGLLTQGYSGLGVNPIEESIHHTGQWALRTLLLTLAIRPASQLFRWPMLVSIRRMCGLFAFAYACLHLLLYAGLDLGFSLSDIWADVMKRWYITLGMLAVLLMIPLAITSTNRAIKALGARRWQLLHRLVYLIGGLGVVHFLMLVKGEQIEPRIYALLFCILMLARLPVLGNTAGTKKKAGRLTPGQSA